MSKEMRSLLAAPTCLMVILLGAGLMQVACSVGEDELLVKLDQSGMTSDQIIAILNDVEDKSGVTIDGKISVAELLELTSPNCELEGLNYSRVWTGSLIKTGRLLVDMNMEVFQQRCRSIKTKSCLEKIKPRFENVLKEVPRDEKGSYPVKSSDKKLDKLAQEVWDGEKHEKFVSNCVVLLEKLTEQVPSERLLRLDPDDKLTQRWLHIEDSCEKYLQLRCQYVLSPTRLPKDSKTKCEELYKNKRGDFWPNWLHPHDEFYFEPLTSHKLYELPLRESIPPSHM